MYNIFRLNKISKLIVPALFLMCFMTSASAFCPGGELASLVPYQLSVKPQEVYITLEETAKLGVEIAAGACRNSTLPGQKVSVSLISLTGNPGRLDKDWVVIDTVGRGTVTYTPAKEGVFLFEATALLPDKAVLQDVALIHVYSKKRQGRSYTFSNSYLQSQDYLRSYDWATLEKIKRNKDDIGLFAGFYSRLTKQDEVYRLGNRNIDHGNDGSGSVWWEVVEASSAGYTPDPAYTKSLREIARARCSDWLSREESEFRESKFSLESLKSAKGWCSFFLAEKEQNPADMRAVTRGDKLLDLAAKSPSSLQAIANVHSSLACYKLAGREDKVALAVQKADELGAGLASKNDMTSLAAALQYFKISGNEKRHGEVSAKLKVLGQDQAMEQMERAISIDPKKLQEQAEALKKMDPQKMREKLNSMQKSAQEQQKYKKGQADLEKDLGM